MKYIFSIILLIAALALASWWFTRPAEPKTVEALPEPDKTETELTTLTKTTPPAAPAKRIPLSRETDENDRSPLADGLNDEKGTIETDLTIVQSVLFNYRTVYRFNPVGTNAEMMRFLTGDNPRGLAFIPADHPSLNENGELVDRWETPFFFHQVSRDEMEIRSAGPDRQMWTEDDAFIP